MTESNFDKSIKTKKRLHEEAKKQEKRKKERTISRFFSIMATPAGV